MKYLQKLYPENIVITTIVRKEVFLMNDKVLIMEAVSPTTHIALERLYPSIEGVLRTPVGDTKFKRLVGEFMDKNNEKLHTPGPLYMIPFGDIDKGRYYELFNLNPKDIVKMVTEITSSITAKSDFKLLRGNPIFWVFYFCIRYYMLKKDEKGLNAALAIYALASYPSIFYSFFRYEPDAVFMQYTMDHLSYKFIMKQEGHLFGGLFASIQNSYNNSLRPGMEDASDGEVIRFIQRIRNDQKSMIKNICDVYMKNKQMGKRLGLNKSSNADTMIDTDLENNTSVVEVVSQKIVLPLITSGLDLKRVNQARQLANISLAECRFYLSKIVSVKYTDEINNFVSSILFLFLYTDRHPKGDINSSQFLVWSSELFRKTNSNDENIRTIKECLDKWADDTGIHKKYKREATRVGYKKAIFWYFILSIQALNQ